MSSSEKRTRRYEVQRDASGRWIVFDTLDHFMDRVYAPEQKDRALQRADELNRAWAEVEKGRQADPEGGQHG